MTEPRDREPRKVNTDGGSYVEGDVTADGDFISRDQNIQGDVVKGDKIVNITTAPTTQTEQPLPPSPRWRRAITINTILIGVLTFLAAIFTNIATGILPESWKPHLWLAWPLAALVTSVSIWLTIRGSALEDGSTPVPPSLAQRNRQAMLKRVRLDWIDGVLRKSLYREVLISLGLQDTPGAIARPVDTLVQRPKLHPQPLPAGTKIIDVFDQAGVRC